MSTIDAVLGAISNALFTWILVWLLLGAGIYFTIRARAVQLRHIASIGRAVVGSRSGAHGGISSFQAFAMGLACRVGTGNIVGVALALILGGPGAVLWMWVVAVLGTATAFTESTLAQLFKVRRPDGSFRGGPAYYISRGLRLPVVGGLFAVVFMTANGLAMPMVQANAIANALGSAGDVPAWASALIVVTLTAPVLLGGLRAIARVTEWLAPFMAVAYLLLVTVIIVTHPIEAWNALWSIVEGAFGLRAGLAGLAGGVTQAVLNGVRRGLFSNEAGLGGAACAAGAATVAHPVQQGFIQAFGVVLDTLFICTATALAILVAGERVYVPGVTEEAAAGSLTQNAIAALMGEWTRWPMAVLIVVLAYSTILGAFSYAQVNLDYLTSRPWLARALQIGAVACAAVGSFQKLATVWSLADILLGLGAIINLVALVLLCRWVLGALRDWEACGAKALAMRAGRAQDDGAPVFSVDSPYLPGVLPGDAWPHAAPEDRPQNAAEERRLTGSSAGPR